jgi:hypothetical protein
MGLNQGLDGRHRDKDGEISKKHGNTLIGTLRDIRARFRAGRGRHGKIGRRAASPGRALTRLAPKKYEGLTTYLHHSASDSRTNRGVYIGIAFPPERPRSTSHPPR